TAAVLAIRFTIVGHKLAAFCDDARVFGGAHRHLVSPRRSAAVPLAHGILVLLNDRLVQTRVLAHVLGREPLVLACRLFSFFFAATTVRCARRGGVGIRPRRRRPDL